MGIGRGNSQACQLKPVSWGRKLAGRERVSCGEQEGRWRQTGRSDTWRAGGRARVRVASAEWQTFARPLVLSFRLDEREGESCSQAQLRSSSGRVLDATGSLNKLGEHLR